MWLVVMVFAMVIPHVTVVSPFLASRALHHWAHHSALHAREIKEAQQHLNEVKSNNVMCVCLATSGELRAVSLIERIRGQKTILWTLASQDHDSGTALLRALHRIMGADLHIDYQVAERWHIAWKYFCS